MDEIRGFWSETTWTGVSVLSLGFSSYVNEYEPTVYPLSPPSLLVKSTVTLILLDRTHEAMPWNKPPQNVGGWKQQGLSFLHIIWPSEVG